jgi:hypothetical protein
MVSDQQTLIVLQEDKINNWNRTTCSDSSSTYVPTATSSMDYYDIRFCVAQNNSSNYNFTTLCTFDDPSNCTTEVDYTVPSFNVMDHY